MFPITAYGLAYWQYERRKWKLNLLSIIDERAGAEPVPLADLYVSYLKVHDLTIYIFSLQAYYIY